MTETPQNPEKTEQELIIESLQFYGDILRFNATLFQGFKIILDKVTSMETQLNRIEEKLNGS